VGEFGGVWKCVVQFVMQQFPLCQEKGAGLKKVRVGHRELRVVNGDRGQMKN